MQSVTRSALLTVIALSLIASESASGQVLSLPGSNAALRDRGIISRLNSRREARQERLNRPAPGNPPNAAADAARAKAAEAQARNAQARNPQALSGQPELAPDLDGNPGGQPAAPSITAAGSGPAGSVRSAQYAARDQAELAAGTQPASGETPLPPNRLPYVGSGVSLSLPADLPGEVNYLIDDSQHMVIASGEEQHLRAKGRYEIRFSRGIDDTGRSYGEARYTITEGTYRFVVTEKGWELYRQADASQPLAINPTETFQPVVPEPLQPSELSEIRHGEPLDVPPSNSVKAAETAEPTEPETLPTPTLRSILEPNS